MADEASVSLQLRFARASHPDTAARLLEVRPHSRESRQHVLELGELDLELGFAGPRPRCEDIEDQLGAVHHTLAGSVLDVFPLRWGQLIVEDDERRILRVDERPELLDLSLPQVGRGVGSIDLLRDGSDDDGTSGIDELLELLEVLIEIVARGRPFARRADKEGALDRRREGYQIAGDEGSFQDSGVR